GSSSGGGGGGCSSSKKKNNGYVGSGSDYDSDDDYSTSSGGSSTSGSTASSAHGVRVTMVACARRASGKRKAVTYASVMVTTDPGVSGTYEVEVDFKDAAGGVVDSADTEVTLTSGDTQTLRVPMDFPNQVSKVRTCEPRVTPAI
uniref:hypothetical protein n=1 Tax=Streptomyces odonnellii TaxID=1417980 RepID=UPI000625CE4E